MTNEIDMTRFEGHTAGPWRWEYNAEHRSVHVVGGRPLHDLTVMDFARWGMGGATPVFRDVAEDGMNIMHKLSSRPDWVAPFSGRQHHAGWCSAVVHPDALLMAAAPALLAEVTKLRAEIAALKADAERYRWLRVQHWSTGPLCVVKSPKNAVKLGYDCPSRQLLDSAIDAEISVPAKPAEPEPGEWVEWNGGECPIADGVFHEVRLKDGRYLLSLNAGSWLWIHRGECDDIAAYRVLP